MIETEEEVRVKSRIWIAKWLKRHPSHKIIFGPEITHGKGNLSDFLKNARWQNAGLNSVWNNLKRIVSGFEIQPDVVVLVEKNDHLLWFVFECKFGEVDIHALRQALLYATVLQANKAFITSVGSMKRTVQTLYSNNVVRYVGTNIHGVERMMHIGHYIYNPVHDDFKPNLPPDGIL